MVAKGGGSKRKSSEAPAAPKRAKAAGVEEVAAAWTAAEPSPVDDATLETLYEALTDAAALEHLEFAGYLDKALWPRVAEALGGKAALPPKLVLSVLFVLNEKHRSGTLGAAWAFMARGSKAGKVLGKFFEAVVAMGVGGLGQRERVEFVLFLIRCYEALDVAPLRKPALKIVSLPLWEHLTPARLKRELRAFPQLQRHWQHLRAKKVAQATVDANFFPSLVAAVIAAVEGADPTAWDVRFVERGLELLVDLLNQLPTRRFLRTYLHDARVVERCAVALLGDHRPTELFVLTGRLLGEVRVALSFAMNDQTGLAPKRGETAATQHDAIRRLQVACFTHFPGDPLTDRLAFGSVAAVASETALASVLEEAASQEILEALAVDKLKIVDGALVETYDAPDRRRAFLIQVLVHDFAVHDDEIAKTNELPLFPNEATLWDAETLPPSSTYGQRDDAAASAAAASNNQNRPLVLPKLNLQFLTFHDYLLRSFKLYALEATYEIRGDVVDAVKRVDARLDDRTGGTTFRGWARMATPIVPGSFRLLKVAKPRLGASVPAEVRCEVRVDLRAFGDRGAAIREEWESLREHDVVFLAHVDATAASPQQQQQQQQQQGNQQQQQKTKTRVVPDEEDCDFPLKRGVRAVRGASITAITDEDGELVGAFARARNMSREGGPRKAGNNNAAGSVRTVTLALDPAQFRMDSLEGEEMVYETLNLLIRRKPKENNFRPVLETIRDLINADAVDAAVPDWLRDVFLGYGDARAAHHLALKDPEDWDEVDAGDTFLDAAHLEATVGKPVDFVNHYESESPSSESESESSKNFKLKFLDDRVVATAYDAPRRIAGAEPKRNAVRFTSTQIGAIMDGVHRGLTCVVGPPGTGKTDVAVQIVANIYRNFPKERTLLIAHSNAALNDLFEKIVDRDHVAPRHLLRLGAGSADLDVDESYSRIGRVDANLSRRLELLDRVHRLAASLGRDDVDAGYTCETAEYFYTTVVDRKIRAFREALAKVVPLAAAAESPGNKKKKTTTTTKKKKTTKKPPPEPEPEPEPEEQQHDKGAYLAVETIFPFSAFFAAEDGGAALFTPAMCLEDCVAVAAAHVDHVEATFGELRDYQALELLRSSKQRTDYLLTTQARIVAMTCTHAALARRDLVRLGFRYDNVIVEEAAQILEIEAFVPLVLQPLDDDDGGGGDASDDTTTMTKKKKTRLKRVVLIGDDGQLPPVVKHSALSKYAHLDQSLFHRFQRLGTPRVVLDAQGRTRPSIANLFNWRYDLGGGAAAGADDDGDDDGAAADTTTTATSSEKGGRKPRGASDNKSAKKKKSPQEEKADDAAEEASPRKKQQQQQQPSKLLGNLPHTTEGPFRFANPGFAHEFQFIDVADFQGRGESTPTPYFYQNLGEAEYVVATYMYMRLLGYPARRITILATYNGQKQLLRDILARRCERDPRFGLPYRVDTVDKYQGQQNDYVLLSLVRTLKVGHLRDPRRLVVAMSRARLGLYTFGRLDLFRACNELKPTFDALLAKKPTKLAVVLNDGDYSASTRKVDDTPPSTYDMADCTEMGVLVQQMATAAAPAPDFGPQRPPAMQE